jgi:ketopantoate hydroxymethyltransferase
MRAAVCLAQHDEVRAGILRGFDGFERVFGVFLEAVEKVFRIVEHLAAVLLQIGNGVGDHGQVFLQRDLENFRDMQRPKFCRRR